MAELERAIEALKRADAAGNADDARKLAQAVKQLRAEQSEEPGLLSRAGSAIGSAAESVMGAVRGQQDPRFADVPGFTGQGLSSGENLQLAGKQAVTFDDPAYGDVIKSQLGDRLLGTETDEHGFEIVTYRGDDGETHQAYVNKPGLDMQDVGRVAMGAIPFAASATPMGAVARGLGLGTKGLMATQGATAAGTSVAADKAAEAMGSEQGIDPMRAAIAGGAGALFEGLSRPLASAWRAIMGKGGVGSDGKLTGQAVERARKLGLDPDDMNERLSRAFAREMNIARDSGELGGKFRTGEFGIPTTKGQRTKQPQLLGSEEEMRRGLMGRDAQSIMGEFDKGQAQAIRGAVQDDIGGRLAPQAAGREQATLGTRVREGARSAREAAEEAEGRVWGEVGPAYPADGAFSMLPANLTRQVQQAGVRPDPQLTPSAHRMMQELEGFASGEPVRSPYALLGEETGDLTIDEMRRRLLGLFKSAEAGSPDARAARALYNGFNDWIDDIASLAGINGAPDVAAKLQTARAFTRDLKSLFEPRDQSGKLSAAGRKIREVLDEADSGEGVIASLLGRGGPTSAPPKGTVDALRQMKLILQSKNKEAWNDIRLAHWVKLAQDNKGEILTPKRLQNNIKAAFENQKSVMDTLYSQEEQRLMRRLQTALDDVTFTPPNPSGTSYELERMRQRSPASETLKTFFGAAQKRATFSQHNFAMARLYQLLSKYTPASLFGSKEGAGASLARHATGQRLTKRPGPPSTAGIGAAGAAQTREQRQ